MKAAFSYHLGGFLSALLLLNGNADAATITDTLTPGDRMLAEYFRAETAKLESACLADVQKLADWTSRREEYRRQLLEMLGLSPLPPRTDLQPVVTGKIEHELFTVEKLHFQSLPQLYVTANLYLPKGRMKPAPAVLYVCGHSLMKRGDVSFGNKTGYQHHGEWFARNGYVCLVIDTIQLGELEGIHHGTYREGMWWWNSRGYTPAGVEAWNGIRALDYLQSRPEVDGQRLGITGRSGGGSYSWTIAALDERIKVAAPVAGITDLHNHVVDGTVAGHCDCMFTVNTYRWDYPQLAALIAPRPLLIGNTDKDSIFPLDGVLRLHHKIRRLYQLYGATNNLALLITEGPHKDTQDLQVPVLRWFNRHLKAEEPAIETSAIRYFEPEQLKVFAAKPADERTTKIHETFVPPAVPPPVPDNPATWKSLRDDWRRGLREKCFRGWPQEGQPLQIKPAFAAKHNGVQLRAFDFVSQEHVPLRLYLLNNQKYKPKAARLQVLDAQEWDGWLAKVRVGFEKSLAAEFAVTATLSGTATFPNKNEKGFDELLRLARENQTALAFVAPRGLGLGAWNPSPREQPQISRRFMLLGQTVDSMRVWDIRRSGQALREILAQPSVPLEISASGPMAVNVLYASLFDSPATGLKLASLPRSHRNGPDYLNVLRILDVPQTLALAVERCPVELSATETGGWEFPQATVGTLNWGRSRLQLRP